MGYDKNKFIKLIKDNCSFDSGRRFVVFDPLWYDPKTLRLSSTFIANFILSNYGEIVNQQAEKLVILSPDNVEAEFGIIPITMFVAEKLDCRVAFWKEITSFKWASSAILGPKQPGLKCIVLQHVVRHGTTALRLSQAFKELNWDFLAYIAVILNSTDGLDQINEALDKNEEVLGKRPEFKYLVKIDELGY